MKNLTIEFLSANGGDRTALLPDTAFDGRIQEETRFPQFDTAADALGGLKIAINDTWGNEVYVTNYIIEGSAFRGTMRFEIYDHFGLDKADMQKNFSLMRGFRCWFVLQHHEMYAGTIQAVCDRNDD